MERDALMCLLRLHGSHFLIINAQLGWHCIRQRIFKHWLKVGIWKPSFFCQILKQMPKRRDLLEIKLIGSCCNHKIKTEIWIHLFFIWCHCFIKNLNFCCTISELDLIHHQLYAFIFRLDWFLSVCQVMIEILLTVILLQQVYFCCLTQLLPY
jgi:hypothetical protein